MVPHADTAVLLARDTNQALGIGRFALAFLNGELGPGPSGAVLDRTALFHADAFFCGASALALGTNAPTILRAEALDYLDPRGAAVFGSAARSKAEKAIAANASAVREWDSNGTNFGFNPKLGHIAGEFGHNDFYPVVLAACQQRGLDGNRALLAMVLLDEIRGRLAEVFSLKTHKIDHVVHGAIASAAVYGALMGATAEQIESAIGMFVAHATPWRAIRAGKQLSDSKGASAAISTEIAITFTRRAMAGFLGPRDIFRNPESLFRQFEPTAGDCPFDLVLSHSGDDFAVMGMHFKLGLYEHQSAGALQGILDLVLRHPEMLEPGAIEEILVLAYEPAFGIIGDPAKRDPKTRQSADHSMVYIVSTLLRKALEAREREALPTDSTDSLWKALMLEPYDYDRSAIFNDRTRALMALMRFEHGGPDYDARYPDGIPTSLRVRLRGGRRLETDLVMYPAGHARNRVADRDGILRHKFALLGGLAYDRATVENLVARLLGLRDASADDLSHLYDDPIANREYAE